MDKHEAYRRGMAAFNAGDFAEAIGQLEKSVGVGGPCGLLSRFYLAQGHHQIALEHFRRMRFKEAAGHFETAARLNPCGGGVERFLAACYVKAGRFDLAIGQLQPLFAKSPDDPETRIRLALACWKAGHPQQALHLLQEGTARRPEHAELHYQLGVVYAAGDELEQAESSFARAVECDPKHLSALERWAQCCGARGDCARSLQLLRQAQAVDPRHPRIGFQLAVLAQQAAPAQPAQPPIGASATGGELDPAAIERLGELMVSEPDFIAAFLSLPTSDMDREVFSTLAVTLERALERHPEYADLHYHCGAVYRRLGQHEAAIQHAEKAIGINPRFVSALILLGELYSQSERIGDSVERLESAIRLGADYADVHHMLGRLYQKTGQRLRARDAFERALKLNRRYQPAQDALVALQSEP